MNPALQSALKSVKTRGLALKSVVQVSAPLRVERGTEISKNSKVRRMTETADELQAQVLASSDGGVLRTPYSVWICFEGNQVRTHYCNCPDHGTSGACKHVIAVALVWINTVGRPMYQAIKKAAEIAS